MRPCVWRGLVTGIWGSRFPGEGCCFWEQQGREQQSKGKVEIVPWCISEGWSPEGEEEGGGVKLVVQVWA